MSTLLSFHRDVKTRLTEVLQARLPDTIPQNAPLGLTMLEPELMDYWMPGNHLPDAIISSPIAVIVRQVKSARYSDPGSGDGDEDCITGAVPFEVRVIFSEDAFESVEVELFGRSMDQSEYYTEVAQAYSGAIMQALYESAQDGRIIDLIELTSSFAASEQFREGMRAVAYTEWLITTRLTRPLDTRYTNPASAITSR